MDFPMPYFMGKPEWYRFDKKKYICKLTKKAPEEAKESYEEFYAPGGVGEQVKRWHEELNDPMSWEAHRKQGVCEACGGIKI